MNDKALDSLKEIVDRLGPDLWLVLEEVAVERYFGRSSLAMEAAQAFADRNECAFIRDKKAIKFGRAYYKRDADA